MDGQAVQKTNWSLMALQEKRRQDIIAMIEACGLSLNDIPRDTPLSRRGESVFLERFVRGDAGGIRFDEILQGPVTEEIEIHPSPEFIPDWLPAD